MGALAVLVAFFVSSLVIVSEVRSMSPGTVPQAQLSENPDETSPGQNLLSQSFNASLMNATHMNTKLKYQEAWIKRCTADDNCNFARTLHLKAGSCMMKNHSVKKTQHHTCVNT